ncbi:MAG: rod shape-determining protein MreD [Candidatus Omnitrophota bacterium]|jgi:rod shape-determining protein MreD|nr:MAG: rod shape-determining protein MreD [Candidatus Omnitrophota bacterium]
MISMIIFIITFFGDLIVRIVLNPGAWSPDLLLLSVLYITLNRPLGEAYLYAFLAGLCWDSVFFEIPGTHSLLFILAAMITAKLRLVIWAQFSISRLVIGVLAVVFVRFGEVIFWLSYLEYEIPLILPYKYILYGSIVTGICFMIYPMLFLPIQSILQKNTQPMIFLGR